MTVWYASEMDDHRSGFIAALDSAIAVGSLLEFRDGLERVYASTPRWRWLKRFHIERQAMIVELCVKAWNASRLYRSR